MRKLATLLVCGISLTCTIQAQKTPTTDYFKKGKIHLVNSSHQDIAWVNSFQVCKSDRANHIMIPVLKRMAENSSFCYSVESAMYLEEFLSLYPEKYDEVLKYTREGRLEWGATYSQPYQGMYSGEALVRQGYLGRKLLKRLLPGCDFKAAWNLDVPGLSLQFPQIMAKSGIPYYNISRFTTGFYQWGSPDGSHIKVASTGQYSGYSGQVLALKTDAERSDALVNIVNYWGDYQKKRKIAPACLALLSQDCTLPVDFDSLQYNWNLRKDTEKELKNLPIMEYSTSTMFFDHLTSNSKAAFNKINGERPNVWLYIHGPTHHKAVAASRNANRLLTAAEKFSTIRSLQENDWSLYPSQTFENAWKNAIFADHGWGGNQGVSTDRLFREKFEAAADTASSILQLSLSSISRNIKYNKAHLYAISVFNPLSWKRTDPVTFTIDAEGRPHNHLKIVDELGNEVPSQLTDNHSIKGNRDEVLTFLFIPEAVPAMGYKTYYLVDDPSYQRKHSKPNCPEYSNQFYTMKLGKGGIDYLYDKELNCEILNTKKFKGAELFTIKSEGTGAGEFADVQQPTMDGFDKLSNYNTSWNCIESGPIRDVFQTSAQFKDTKTNLRIVMYHHLKKIDVEVDLNGYMGDNWREYRLAFPLNNQQKSVAYDVPMGTVQVGKDEMDGSAGHKGLQPAYDVACSTVHPREVQDWFSAWGGGTGLTISSDVAIFDWIDPTDVTSSNYVLQPVLISGRKSCHGLGNHYLQPGNHSYRFSIYSHTNDWTNGYHQGIQSNQTLEAIVTHKDQMKEGKYPETYSFVNIDDTNVMISALKKCEDDNSAILRCYDMTGNSRSVNISLFKDLKKVEHVNMIEEEGQAIKSGVNNFSYPIEHHAIETFKFYETGDTPKNPIQ